MKEKIGIEKLIRYLLESKGEEYKEEYYEWYRDVELEQNIDSLSELKPFIKWLVENDKIDIHNIPPISITKGEEERAYNEPVMLDDRLLMLLSISDTPIEFLISILKNV